MLGKAKGTGTTVRFKPDPEIFTVLEFHYTTLADRLRQLAFLNKGVTITLKDEREDPTKEETFFAKGGLVAVRAVAQPEQEAAAPEADRLHAPPRTTSRSTSRCSTRTATTRTPSPS